MTSSLEDTRNLRNAIIEGCRWMNRSGLNQGTSGNISVRTDHGLLVTPSGWPYDRMTSDMIQHIPSTGAPSASGSVRPTSEWRFHQALLAARPDMTAVVHAHPAHATALAVQRRSIPACHYMIAAFGGSDVPLVDYALFGGSELAASAAKAMQDRHGCLLANHGAIVLGETLERALWRMEELENLARVYLLALTTGDPIILSDAEMQDVIEAFAGYGLQTE